MSDEDLDRHVDRHVLKRYDTKGVLGKGAYGIVWRAVDRRSGETVALKKIFDAFQNSTDAQRTFREVMFLQEMKGHENIVSLLSVLKSDNDRDFYLVFECMETDLLTAIRGNVLQDIHKQYVTWQMLKALKYMHSAELLHRDMKPSNLLLNSDCVVKVADFGLARSLRECASETKADDAKLTDYVATRWYRAPEILLGSPSYSFGVDVWAVGCIVGEMLVGKPIFPGATVLSQCETIFELLGKPDEERLRAISCYSKEMLAVLDDTRMPQGPEVLNAGQYLERWRRRFPGVGDDGLRLLIEMLRLDPHDRVKVIDALNHPYVAPFHNAALEGDAGFTALISIGDNEKKTTQVALTRRRAGTRGEPPRRAPKESPRGEPQRRAPEESPKGEPPSRPPYPSYGIDRARLPSLAAQVYRDKLYSEVKRIRAAERAQRNEERKERSERAAIAKRDGGGGGLAAHRGVRADTEHFGDASAIPAHRGERNPFDATSAMPAHRGDRRSYFMDR